MNGFEKYKNIIGQEKKEYTLYLITDICKYLINDYGGTFFPKNYLNIYNL